MNCTIFKNIYSKEPHYIEVDKALDRIKNEWSKEQVTLVRSCLDKERGNELKKNLPSVCFSGKFGKNRTDSELIEHSNFIVLDFDKISDCENKKKELSEQKFVYATWISPSGNGVKALVKIADGKKHKEHFQALQDLFPEIDKSGINPSRVCYESIDRDIFINTKATAFTKVKTIERVVETIKKDNQIEIFNNILKWLSNMGHAFQTGERNLFIFKLAGACCRFGISSDDCLNLCNMSILRNDNEFTNKEAQQAIKSAYKQNNSAFNTASFENEKLVDKISKAEVDITSTEIYDLEIKPKDVIFGEDVKADALKLYDNGYESAKTTHIPEIDIHFKFKKGENTLLSGYGNYGKSTMLKYLLFMQVINDKEKIAIFSPEELPAHEFYHDLVEMWFGQSCTPDNPNRPSKEDYEKIYDLVSKHFFFVYPMEMSPTPKYIKERFLELIIKEGVRFCIIDPFNQLSNDYKSAGRSDKYLEIILSDFGRFAQINNIYLVIVAHPRTPTEKNKEGNYICPEVYDIADGAMWNNKMDNIVIYHLPNRQSNYDDTTCEFHSKKIRRRKIVGKLGFITFEFFPRRRRFFFNGHDYMADAIAKRTEYKQSSLTTNTDFLNEPHKLVHKDDWEEKTDVYR